MSKGLEALERIIETFYNKESEDIKIVEKGLKALEIIKPFVNIDMLMFKGLIAQEEYDLLKEVL